MKLCITESCGRPVRARNLCASHYEKFRTTELPETIRHSVSEVNLATKTGTCSQCGPDTPIRVEKNRNRCAVARRANSNLSRTYRYGSGTRVPKAEYTAARARFYVEQEGRCAVCKRTEEEVGTLHLDHCHTTGELRGLLCTGCNTGIGLLQDSVDILQAASEYLTR